ncbi:MAG: undecaprenyl-diphosphate phosphatase [Lachnospiraceae bacterium]
MNFIEWLRIIIIGIVEGVTEWLPVSSTGHMILVRTFWETKVPEIITPEFWSMFEVVIQLGAILAVVTIFFHKLNPWSPKKTEEQKKNTFSLWGKVIVGCIPAGIAGLLLDDWMDAHLYNAYVVATMLIIYGIAYIVVENRHKGKSYKINKFSELSYQMALYIGLIQVLSLIPGTSRSGVTIVGALMLGCSRYIAAEYTFYLAIPVMFGASALKMFKYLLEGGGFAGPQLPILIVGSVVAYLVSIFVIKFLMGYIKKHDFKVFGYYRIALGILVFIIFIITGKSAV